MNPYYYPFFQPRRAPMRAPRRKSVNKKKGTSSKRGRSGTTITYNNRLLINTGGGTPVQLNPTLKEALGTQSTSAATWWSQFRVDRVSFKVVKVSKTPPNENVVFDSFPNPDGNKPASSAEFLREQGKRTRVYVPGKTGAFSLGSCNKPKYDATGSGNQFTNVNLLDANDLSYAVEWNGVCFMTDTDATVEIDQQLVVTWYGAH